MGSDDDGNPLVHCGLQFWHGGLFHHAHADNTQSRVGKAMLAMAEQHESYYTPQKVEMLLRQLPYLLDRHSYEEHKTPAAKRQAAGGRVEEQMVKRADVEWALCSLPQPTYRIVFLCCVSSLSLRDVAEVVGYSHTTVRHHKTEGLKLMAHRLGWRSPDDGWV